MTEAKTSFLIYKQKTLNLLKSKFMPPSVVVFFKMINCSWEMNFKQLTEAYVLACVENTVTPQLEVQSIAKSK